MHKPLRERRALMLSALPHMRPGYVQLAAGSELVTAAPVTAAATADAAAILPALTADATAASTAAHVTAADAAQGGRAGGVGDAVAGGAAVTGAGRAPLVLASEEEGVEVLKTHLLQAVNAGTEGGCVLRACMRGHVLGMAPEPNRPYRGCPVPSTAARPSSSVSHLTPFTSRVSCAGLMLKRLDHPGAGYEPSKRSESWVKVGGWEAKGAGWWLVVGC